MQILNQDFKKMMHTQSYALARNINKLTEQSVFVPLTSKVFNVEKFSERRYTLFNTFVRRTALWKRNLYSPPEH